MKTCVLALEVLQTWQMWSPCFVGSIICCCWPAPWGRQFRFFQHLCGGNAWKTAFLNISTWLTYFLTVCCARARHGAPLFSMTCKYLLLTLRGDHLFFFIFHGWLVAMRKACGYLRKCVSHPAWGSHVGFRCSIGELLLCGSLEISLENKAKHIVRYANWGLPVHTWHVLSWPFSLSFLNTSQGGKKGQLGLRELGAAGP